MASGISALQLFLNIVPESLHGRATATACNHLLKGQNLSRRLTALDGKRLWLTITDTNTRLRYRFNNGQLGYDPDRHTPDIHIHGKLKYFLQLATRNEDPDTLFFARQLSLEGNTEDGLVLKNFLDALEFDTEAHLKAWLGERLTSPLLPVLKRLQPGKQINHLIEKIV